jgi:hypothetical protein
MAGHNPIQRPLQRCTVQLPLQPPSRENVIGFAGSHLRQKPQPLLRKRQWKMFPTLSADYRLHGGARGSLHQSRQIGQHGMLEHITDHYFRIQNLPQP